MGLKWRMITGERVVNIAQHGLRHIDVFRVGKVLNDPVREKGSVNFRATIDHVSVIENVKYQGKPSRIRHII